VKDARERAGRLFRQADRELVILLSHRDFARRHITR
jgi:hypothetical protein